MKDRKVEIRNAAKKIFLENGMSKTTMVDIAKNTSIARSTIYEYYSSKEDILYDLLKEIISEKPKIYKNLHFEDQLIEIAKYFFERLRNNYEIYKLLFQEIPVLNKQSKTEFNIRQDNSLNIVSEVFSKEIDNNTLKRNLNVEDLTFYFKALVGQKMSDF